MTDTSKTNENALPSAEKRNLIQTTQDTLQISKKGIVKAFNITKEKIATASSKTAQKIQTGLTFVRILKEIDSSEKIHEITMKMKKSLDKSDLLETAKDLEQKAKQIREIAKEL